MTNKVADNYKIWKEYIYLTSQASTYYVGSLVAWVWRRFYVLWMMAEVGFCV